jgi:hypothetical protein
VHQTASTHVAHLLNAAQGTAICSIAARLEQSGTLQTTAARCLAGIAFAMEKEETAVHMVMPTAAGLLGVAIPTAVVQANIGTPQAPAVLM